ncbi:unnamed protein product [Adineta ricciae]|uniref:Ferritin-like domain-containing protein n=1 Tax=Adineta ricciae TaxID=249248 RepID=A0A814AUS8_ADIRI|nr:unnamed protein product [Adineta ricciae]CAF1048620.1 unnamed protein product [Adineta ricciae]
MSAFNTNNKDEQQSVASAPRNNSFVLIGLCCIGLILFLIAATIVLSLIPLYLSAKDISDNTDTVSLNVTYRINNGTLPLGTLSTDNCKAILTDLKTQTKANQAVSRLTPSISSCTVTGSTTVPTNLARRRRQTTSEGNVITYICSLKGGGNCRRGSCLGERAQILLASLLQRGIFYLTFTGSNGTRFLFSISAISSNYSSSSDASANDIAALNYVLYLTRLQSSLYERFQSQFNQTAFISAGYAAQAYTYLNLILSHQRAHVNTLVSSIIALAGSAIPACTYNFNSITSVTGYLSAAQQLGQVGANAYVGVISGLTDPSLIELFGQLGDIEARHTVYLSQLVTNSSIGTFPENFTKDASVADTYSATNSYITSCSFTLPQPLTILPGAFTFNGTIPAISSTITNYSRPMYDNDNRVLQLALNTEQMGVALYQTFINKLTNTIYSNMLTYFQLIYQHELAHVAFLRQTLQNRGATPVATCNYTFTPNITDAASFIAYASIFENLETALYAYTANAVADPLVLTPLAGIFTVEAKHAGFLNNLNGISPFPDILNPTMNSTQVLSILAPNQICGYKLAEPVVSYLLVINATSLPNKKK